jgi:hypothetical protein
MVGTLDLKELVLISIRVGTGLYNKSAIVNPLYVGRGLAIPPAFKG